MQQRTWPSERGDTHPKIPELEEGSCHVGEVSQVVFRVNCPFGEQPNSGGEHSGVGVRAGLPGAGLPAGDALSLLEDSYNSDLMSAPGFLIQWVWEWAREFICISSRLWSGGSPSRTIPSEEGNI